MNTKALIADAAYRLLTQKPITELTIAEIAAESGVSSRTIYNHFEDKFEIVQYICKQLDDEYYSKNKVTISDLCFKNAAQNDCYLWKHKLFFLNILCYHGQNNCTDYMSKLMLARILRNIQILQDSKHISEELLASAESYSYTLISLCHAMLKGILPARWQNIDIPACELYMPKPLYEFFSQHNIH